VRLGRPLKLSHHQRREALERMDPGESVVDVARTFGWTAQPCIGCKRCCADGRDFPSTAMGGFGRTAGAEFGEF